MPLSSVCLSYSFVVISVFEPDVCGMFILFMFSELLQPLVSVFCLVDLREFPVIISWSLFCLCARLSFPIFRNYRYVSPSEIFWLILWYSALFFFAFLLFCFIYIICYWWTEFNWFSILSCTCDSTIYSFVDDDSHFLLYLFYFHISSDLFLLLFHPFGKFPSYIWPMLPQFLMWEPFQHC